MDELARDGLALPGDDDGDQTSARVAVAAVRVEAIGLAAGAAGDILDFDAGELRADGGAEIDECLVVGSTRDERLADALGDVEADLEATWSDAGTDRGEDRLRGEPLDGDVEDARFDAAPTGVDGCDASGVRRGEEDGDAVGDAHRDGVAFARGEDAVGFDLQELGGILVRVHYGPAVYLLRLEEAGVLEADVSRERSEIAGSARREGVPEASVIQGICAEQAE